MLKFLERHAGSIKGTLRCFDRILIQGTLRYIGNSYEITKYFRCRKIMFRRFEEWAKPYSESLRAVQRISRRVRKNDRTYRGFNLFEEDDLAAIRAISQGQHVGFGIRNKHLRGKLPGMSSAQIGRIIKRLRMHGLVKRAARSFKYHLTALGKRVAATALKLKEMFVIPSLRGHLVTT
jgi:hypothetical protein